MDIKILSVRKYKAGYEVRTEEVSMKANPTVIVKSAYTPAGDYIGDTKMARLLVVKRGIAPEKAKPEHNVCSIGFSTRDNKWYGWSHRAICSFGIGSIVEEGDCAASSGWAPEYLTEHPEADKSMPVGFIAKTLDDAKRMAIAFAEAVS